MALDAIGAALAEFFGTLIFNLFTVRSKDEEAMALARKLQNERRMRRERERLKRKMRRSK